MYHLTALVTLLAIAFYMFTCINVSRARTKTGVKVPAMSGHPDFERAFRIQANTLEWMPVFLPALWLFAIYIGDAIAAESARSGSSAASSTSSVIRRRRQSAARALRSRALQRLRCGRGHWGRWCCGWCEARHHARPSPGRGAACNAAPLNRDPIWSRPMEKCGFRLCAAAFHAAARPGHESLTSSAGSRCPWRRRTPCRRGRLRAACNSPTASSIPTAS